MARNRAEASRPAITISVSVTSTPYNPAARDNEARFKELVAFVRRNHVDCQPNLWEDPAKAKAYIYEKVLPKQDRPGFLERLIVDATRDKYAWDALELIAKKHLRTNTLPKPLAEWLADYLDGRTRPRTGSKVELKNREMYLAVYHVSTRFELNPTRRGSDHKRDGMASSAGGSACDVVAAAFNTGYKNAERAWLNRDPILSYRKSRKK
ncbi:MAG: hypothetical protein F4020_05815 [Gammaproteobacteria bacterium]|nr:hypothetical protein [Gammaproteobacteria bacterium]